MIPYGNEDWVSWKNIRMRNARSSNSRLWAKVYYVQFVPGQGRRTDPIRTAFFTKKIAQVVLYFSSTHASRFQCSGACSCAYWKVLKAIKRRGKCDRCNSHPICCLNLDKKGETMHLDSVHEQCDRVKTACPCIQSSKDSPVLFSTTDSIKCGHIPWSAKQGGAQVWA